jgi:hypothetical protein
LGVAAVGMLGALAINGVGSQQPGNRVTAVLQFLHLDDNSLQTQAAVIGLASAAFLTGKTILSILCIASLAIFGVMLYSLIRAEDIIEVSSKTIDMIYRGLENFIFICIAGVFLFQ